MWGHLCEDLYEDWELEIFWFARYRIQAPDARLAWPSTKKTQPGLPIAAALALT